ncbi:hypothetical protein Y032_0021g399 [Ancylostoma ceylanicum]|uniref:Uncharacterized protein n=1 Tax=Ancylostoma ceylanicum TaxID=53326 RepID=A0A016V1Y2_9BILA|nr:hypothetical protein Y032_0021g399 [Ancylostoma ceylanicum]
MGLQAGCGCLLQPAAEDSSAMPQQTTRVPAPWSRPSSTTVLSSLQGIWKDSGCFELQCITGCFQSTVRFPEVSLTFNVRGYNVQSRTSQLISLTPQRR